MKKLFLLLIFLFLLSGCKYDTLDQAFEKQADYEVKEVVANVEVENVVAILYLTEPNAEDFPNIHEDVVAIEFYKNDDGWEKVVNGTWSHYENDNLILHSERYLETYANGKKDKITRITFGEINNEEITKIEVSKDGEHFVPAEIVNNTHLPKRYFYQIGEYPIVRGLSKTGEVIDRQVG
ncbi:MAG: hypothetical protein ACE3JQ_03615 [Paenisporosarcina sp.]